MIAPEDIRSPAIREEIRIEGIGNETAGMIEMPCREIVVPGSRYMIRNHGMVEPRTMETDLGVADGEMRIPTDYLIDLWTGIGAHLTVLQFQVNIQIGSHQKTLGRIGAHLTVPHDLSQELQEFLQNR